MAKKKQKIKFEDLGGYVLDDDGNRREIGTIYPEKFVYKGHANVYKVYRSGDSLAAVACEGEIPKYQLEEWKGMDGYTDDELDQAHVDILITEDSPPFRTHYTLRAKIRYWRSLGGVQKSADKPNE